MIVPTTTAEAWLTPRSRDSSGRESRCIDSDMVEVCQYTREGEKLREEKPLTTEFAEKSRKER
jgi:hypothetical protein